MNRTLSRTTVIIRSSTFMHTRPCCLCGEPHPLLRHLHLEVGANVVPVQCISPFFSICRGYRFARDDVVNNVLNQVRSCPHDRPTQSQSSSIKRCKQSLNPRIVRTAVPEVLLNPASTIYLVSWFLSELVIKECDSEVMPLAHETALLASGGDCSQTRHQRPENCWSQFRIKAAWCRSVAT